MLVLSRKHNEKIVLPTVDVEITVVEIQGDRVRLGIQAPLSLPVHRDEVWMRILQNEGIDTATEATQATASLN